MSNIGLRNGSRNGLILKSSNNRSTSRRRFSNGRHICIAVGGASVFVSVVTGTFVSAFVIVSSFAIGLLLLGGSQPVPMNYTPLDGPRIDAPQTGRDAAALYFFFRAKL